MTSVQCGFPNQPALLVSRGPVLAVKIGFDPSFHPDRPPANVVDRILPALVDTGASECFIDNQVAIDHQLPVVDQSVAVGAFGTSPVNLYLGQVVIPRLGDYTVYGRFAGADLSGLGVQALIGRWPVLSHCKMVYDGLSGSVVLSLKGASS